MKCFGNTSSPGPAGGPYAATKSAIVTRYPRRTPVGEDRVDFMGSQERSCSSDSQVRACGAVDLKQLDGCAVHLDKGNQHAWTGGVRGDDHLLASDGHVEVIDLEGYMRNGLDKIGIGSALPVALPLNAEGILLVIADGDLQLRKRNFTLERRSRRDADMVISHLTIKPSSHPPASVAPASPSLGAQPSWLTLTRVAPSPRQTAFEGWKERRTPLPLYLTRSASS